MTARLVLGTHRGEIRDHNEDAVGVFGWALQGDQPDLLVLDVIVLGPLAVVVCDGMGGHRGGAQASRLAAELLGHLPESSGDAHEQMLDRLQEASDLLIARGETDPGVAGMGSTAVVLLLGPDGTGSVLNVGDSRAYRLADGAFSRLSIDHRREAGSNVLTQVLGGGIRTRLDPHAFRLRVDSGDRLLLCTDGLTDMLDSDTIASIVANDSAEQATTGLIAAARSAGGTDNITVAVVDIAVEAPANDRLLAPVEW